MGAESDLESFLAMYAQACADAGVEPLAEDDLAVICQRDPDWRLAGASDDAIDPPYGTMAAATQTDHQGSSNEGFRNSTVTCPGFSDHS